MSRPRVLAVVDYYLPGFKGGGPIVSVSRMIRALKSEFEFYIFTRDRDLGDTQPYDGITPDEWNDREGSRVFYASPEAITKATLEAVIAEATPDVIYLNSYFSKTTRLALALRQEGKCEGIRFIVAPRGEFSQGALALKAFKKKVYLTLARARGIHEGLIWQVSSEHEERDTVAVLKEHPRTFVLPPLMDVPSHVPTKPIKLAGQTRFVWISRISPKKNLLGAIEAMHGVDGKAQLTVFGPIEDEAYWQQCLAAAKQLPGSVEFIHEGGIPSEQVRERLAEHHFLLFPTLGENFGHVIPEALAAGCPILLSDQTPWLDLEEHGAGWVMPLGDKDAWREAVRRCCRMDNIEYHLRSIASLDYLRHKAEEQGTGADLFYTALAA